MNFPNLKPFLFIIFIALIFLFFRIENGNYRTVDSWDYAKTAQIIKDGSYFKPCVNYEDVGFKTRRPIVYPLFFLIFNGLANDLWVVLAQTILLGFNFFMMFKILQKLNIKSVWLFSCFILLSPTFFIYAHIIMAEILSVTFFILIIYNLLGELTSRKVIYIQLLLILLVFTKPVFYIFTTINIPLFLYFFYKKRMFNLSIFLPFIIVLAYMSFNSYRTGYFHFSSIQNVNLIDYNIYFFKARSLGEDKAIEWKDSVYKRAEEFKTFGEKNEFYTNVGKTEIQKNIISYSWYHFFTTLRGIVDPGRYDLSTFNKQKYDPKSGFLRKLNTENFSKVLKDLIDNYLILIIILLPIFIFKLLRCFWVSRYLWMERRNFNFKHFYLFTFCCYYVFITGPVNVSRYMLFIETIILIVAVLSIEKYGYKLKIDKSKAL